MKVTAFCKRWFTPAPTKVEAIRRYRVFAAVQAVIALAMVTLWALAPGWGADASLPAFSALFLLGAAGFAAMAAATLGATWLIRRNLY